MSSFDPATDGQPEEQPRATWPLFAAVGVLWLLVCAIAFVFMMGWV